MIPNYYAVPFLALFLWVHTQPSTHVKCVQMARRRQRIPDDELIAESDTPLPPVYDDLLAAETEEPRLKTNVGRDLSGKKSRKESVAPKGQRGNSERPLASREKGLPPKLARASLRKKVSDDRDPPAQPTQKSVNSSRQPRAATSTTPNDGMLVAGSDASPDDRELVAKGSGVGALPGDRDVANSDGGEATPDDRDIVAESDGGGATPDDRDIMADSDSGGPTPDDRDIMAESDGGDATPDDRKIVASETTASAADEDMGGRGSTLGDAPPPPHSPENVKDTGKRDDKVVAVVPKPKRETPKPLPPPKEPEKAPPPPSGTVTISRLELTGGPADFTYSFATDEWIQKGRTAPMSDIEKADLLSQLTADGDNVQKAKSDIGLGHRKAIDCLQRAAHRVLQLGWKWKDNFVLLDGRVRLRYFRRFGDWESPSMRYEWSSDVQSYGWHMYSVTRKRWGRLTAEAIPAELRPRLVAQIFPAAKNNIRNEYMGNAAQADHFIAMTHLRLNLNMPIHHNGLGDDIGFVFRATTNFENGRGSLSCFYRYYQSEKLDEVYMFLRQNSEGQWVYLTDNFAALLDEIDPNYIEKASKISPKSSSLDAHNPRRTDTPWKLNDKVISLASKHFAQAYPRDLAIRTKQIEFTRKRVKGAHPLHFGFTVGPPTAKTAVKGYSGVEAAGVWVRYWRRERQWEGSPESYVVQVRKRSEALAIWEDLSFKHVFPSTPPTSAPVDFLRLLSDLKALNLLDVGLWLHLHVCTGKPMPDIALPFLGSSRSFATFEVASRVVGVYVNPENTRQVLFVRSSSTPKQWVPLMPNAVHEMGMSLDAFEAAAVRMQFLSSQIEQIKAVFFERFGGGKGKL